MRGWQCRESNCAASHLAATPSPTWRSAAPLQAGLPCSGRLVGGVGRRRGTCRGRAQGRAPDRRSAACARGDLAPSSKAGRSQPWLRWWQGRRWRSRCAQRPRSLQRHAWTGSEKGCRPVHRAPSDAPRALLAHRRTGRRRHRSYHYLRRRRCRAGPSRAGHACRRWRSSPRVAGLMPGIYHPTPAGSGRPCSRAGHTSG